MGIERFIGFDYTIKYRNPKDSYCLGRNVDSFFKGVQQGIIYNREDIRGILRCAKYIDSLMLSTEKENYVFRHTHFNVGDILIGNEINDYSITNAQTLVKVSCIYVDSIRVKIVNSLSHSFRVGEEYPVNDWCFRIATPEDLVKFDKKEI